jgi:hypothetical protein
MQIEFDVEELPELFEKVVNNDFSHLFTEQEKQTAQKVATKTLIIIDKAKEAVKEKREVYFSADETGFIGKVFNLFSEFDLNQELKEIETDTNAFAYKWVQRFVAVGEKDFDQIADEINAAASIGEPERNG